MQTILIEIERGLTGDHLRVIVDGRPIVVKNNVTVTVAERPHGA
jgi:hypothetical protein